MSKMKIVQGLNQGTFEWHDWRNKHLCASDAAVIMGMRPFGRTPLKLWQEKITGESAAVFSSAMQRGKDLESKARECFIERTGIEVFPEVIECENVPWMGASLDGLSHDQKTAVEIKVHGISAYEKALKGEIAPYIMAQCQHQLFCSDLDYMYYFPFNGENGLLTKIYRDDYFIKKMIAEELEFWERICNFDPPEDN